MLSSTTALKQVEPGQRDCNLVSNTAYGLSMHSMETNFEKNGQDYDRPDSYISAEGPYTGVVDTAEDPYTSIRDHYDSIGDSHHSAIEEQ